MRPSVVIRGMGLSSSLGVGVEACHASLTAGLVAPRSLTMAAFAEPLTLPFYAVPGASDLFDPARAIDLKRAAPELS